MFGSKDHFNQSTDSVGQTIRFGSRSVSVEKKLADGGYAVVYLARDVYSQ